MSLPQNILPFQQNPVQNRSNSLEGEYIRVREKIQAGLKDGRFSLREVARRTGVSYGYISMFLKGTEVSPRILRKMKLGMRMTVTQKPRKRKDKRLSSIPGRWVWDAI